MAKNRWLPSRRRTASAPTPSLSVVIPMHNVREYLDECLTTLLAQTFYDFEGIIIDDGSTDGSAIVAARHVVADDRLRLIRQENGGLGAARNAGIALARGEFITFLDSDDTLPPHAYAVMMDTIRRTGSDMVVGAIKRRGEGRRPMRLMQENHRRRRERVTLDEMPLILADVFAVNKVYRRAFWDRAGLGFPTGARYEDQPALTRAFIAANRFDVIPDTVYHWRIRRDRTSITQRRSETADLVDRITSKRMSTEMVRNLGHQVRDVWFNDVLPVDMQEYFRAAVRGGSEEYWDLLRAGLDEFWNSGTVPFEATRVPAQQRLLGWLVQADRRQDATELVDFLESHAGDPPVELRGGRIYCCLPGLDDPAYGAPADVYVLGDHELVWEAWVTCGGWRESTVSLEGFALIRNVVTEGRSTSLAASLHGPEGRVVDLAVREIPDARATTLVRRRSQNYDACGFAVEVDLERLVALDRPLPEEPAVWRVILRRSVERFVREGPLTGLKPATGLRVWKKVSPNVEGCLSKDQAGVVLELRTPRPGTASSDRPE